jgi:hypothetical protein
LRAPLIRVSGGSGSITGSVVQGTVLENNTREGLRIAPQIAQVTQNSSYSQNHAFGSAAGGTDSGREVAIPSTVQVERIVSQASPITAVDTELPKVEGEVVTEHRPLRSWSHEWSSQSGLSMQQATAFIAIVTAVATSGWGVGLASSLGIGSQTGVAMLTAATSGTMARFTSSTYANNGDVFAGLRDVVSEHSLKAIAVDCLTAGLLNKCTAGLGIPSAAAATKTLGERLSQNMLQAAIRSGLQIAIEGADPIQALTHNFISGAVNTGIGFCAQEIGVAREDLGYVGHKLFHAVLGAVGGQILHKDAASGAVGALSAEVLADFMRDDLDSCLATLYVEERAKGPVDSGRMHDRYMEEINKIKDLSSRGAAATALCVGADVNAAYGAARNAVDNNFVVCAAALFGPELAATWCVLAALTYKIALEYKNKGAQASVDVLAQEGYVEKRVSGGQTVYRLEGVEYTSVTDLWKVCLLTMPSLRNMLYSVMGMDMKPEDAQWIDQGVTPAPSGPRILSTPPAEPSAPLPGTPIQEPTRPETGGFAPHDGPDTSILTKKSTDGAPGASRGIETPRGMWEVKRYDKVAEHPVFGKFYKTTGKNEWWTKDNAQHGGSVWKMFRKVGEELKWKMDVDRYGDQIDKNKGDVGKTIPWKEFSVKGEKSK